MLPHQVSIFVATSKFLILDLPRSLILLCDTELRNFMNCQAILDLCDTWLPVCFPVSKGRQVQKLRIVSHIHLSFLISEVARSEPYNLTADVYSFGLLLWQVCSLDLPYDGMNRQDHSELVVHGNERPPLNSSWSTPLRILMKRAWEPDPSVRPSMDSIYKILKREICALRDGDDSGLEHASRRSTFVLDRESVANKQSKDTSELGRSPRESSSRRSSGKSKSGSISRDSQRLPPLAAVSEKKAATDQVAA